MDGRKDGAMTHSDYSLERESPGSAATTKHWSLYFGSLGVVGVIVGGGVWFFVEWSARADPAGISNVALLILGGTAVHAIARIGHFLVLAVASALLSAAAIPAALGWDVIWPPILPGDPFRLAQQPASFVIIGVLLAASLAKVSRSRAATLG